MNTGARFWEWLAAEGYSVTEPRSRFDPKLEKILEDELDEEVTHGEKEPESVSELPASVRLVARGTSRFVLYVLESALDHGFWGVADDVIRELKNQPLPWALVLLQRDGISGYCFNGHQVARLAKSNWNRIVPGGPNFEVRAPDHVGDAQPFRSENDLQAILTNLPKAR